MPTAVVLLPSTTYRASDFLRAAEGLGVDLVVASENPPPMDMGDRYLQVDCSDPAKAADAIVALGRDSRRETGSPGQPTRRGGSQPGQGAAA
jgi:hypothetical protein